MQTDDKALPRVSPVGRGQRLITLETQILHSYKMERNCSVLECLTRDRGAAGSSLTVLCFLSMTHLS